MSEEHITAPISEYSSVLLASVPRRYNSPATDVQMALLDPTNYAHCLDMRAWGDGDE